MKKGKYGTFLVLSTATPPPLSALQAAIIALKERGVPLPPYLKPQPLN